MLLDDFERNIAPAGTGRMNDSSLAILLHHLNRSLISALIMLKTAAMPHTHTPAAIKEYPPFGSWKIPLIFVLMSILTLFYHKFTSTSIEIPCAATGCRDKNQHFHDIFSNFIQQVQITVIQNWYVYA